MCTRPAGIERGVQDGLTVCRAWEPRQSEEKGVESCHVCPAGVGPVLGVSIVGEACAGGSWCAYLSWEFLSSPRCPWSPRCVCTREALWLCAWRPLARVQVCVPSLASAVSTSVCTCSVVGLQALRASTRSDCGVCPKSTREIKSPV